MYKLLNIADFCSNEELEKDMPYFSKKYGFDGFELIKFFNENNSPLKKYIKGYHMRFFPSWMELYLEDFNSLYAELKDKKLKEMSQANLGVFEANLLAILEAINELVHLELLIDTEFATNVNF